MAALASTAPAWAEQGASQLGLRGSSSAHSAIVTGSNSGIGLGMAWELAKAGADVLLHAVVETAEGVA